MKLVGAAVIGLWEQPIIQKPPSNELLETTLMSHAMSNNYHKIYRADGASYPTK